MHTTGNVRREPGYHKNQIPEGMPMAQSSFRQ